MRTERVPDNMCIHENDYRTMPSMIVRPEAPSDHAAIHALNEAAFGQPDEAELVDALREACPDFLSLVAESNGAIVGHILFTPAHVGKDGVHLEGMGLAPMAVAPEHQRGGIGSALVKAGLDELRANRCPFVIVLGHPKYYPRFGFTPAGTFGIHCQWTVPGKAFMAIELQPGALAPFQGATACYNPAFDG